MEQTRIHVALREFRDEAALDLEALELLLVRFSRLVAEQRWIREIVIDPLHATSSGWRAFDVQMTLHDPHTNEEELPKLAIRPYPSEYVGGWTTKSGKQVTLRPIRPEDEPLFLGAMGLSRRVEHDRLTRLCFIDYDREIALVVDHRNPEGEHRIRGVGRLVRLYGTADAEYSIVISDVMQGQGLGSELLRRLVEVARVEGIRRIVGDVLSDNRRMLKACRRLGFRLHARGTEPTWVELPLD
jgi:acetyltransferase